MEKDSALTAELTKLGLYFDNDEDTWPGEGVRFYGRYLYFLDMVMLGEVGRSR
jgi:hypothetical protein